MCPMYDCLIHMFGNYMDAAHQCNMDNLLNYVSLERAEYVLKKRVLIHGLIRKSGRGVCSAVIQDEQTVKRADSVRGTVKVAVLKCDSDSSDLIFASCYDQKPLYMLTHGVKEVTWV